MATHWTIGADAADPHRLAAFWALALERATLIRAKVDDLVVAGATKVREEEYGDETGHTILGHVVMLDPEGNEFCVA